MSYEEDDLPESDNIEDRRDDDPTIDPNSGGDWEQRLSAYQRGDQTANGGLLRDEMSGGSGQQYKQDLGDDGAGGQMNSALAAVNNALMFGRKQFGIGQQDEGVKTKNYAEGGVVSDDEEPATGSPAGLPEDQEAALEEQQQPNRFQRLMGDAIGMRGREGQERAAQYNPGEYGPDTTAPATGSPAGLPTQAGEGNGQAQFDQATGGQNPFPAGAMLRKRIMSYLQGANAMPADQVAALEQQVDPDGTMPEDQRKLNAVKTASDQGGAPAGFAAIQAYRTKYDGYRSHAAAAMQAGDLQNATRSASQAYANLLDGQSVVFQPGQGGVTATVNGKDQVNLTPDQFNSFLTGDAGQFDHVLENGGAKTLQQLAAQQGPQSGGPAPQRQAPLGPAQFGANPVKTTSQLPDTGAEDTRPFASPGEAARQPGKYRPTPSNYRSPVVPPEDAAETQSRKIFPMASQEQQRQEWVAKQRNTTETNRIAETKARAPVEARDIGGQRGIQREEAKGRTAVAVQDKKTEGYDRRTESNERVKAGQYDAQLKAAMQKAATARGNEQMRAAAAIIAKETTNVPFGTPLSPQAEAAKKIIYQGLGIQDQGTPQQPQGGGQQQPAAPQQQGGGQQPPPDGQMRKQFKQGWGVWDGSKYVPEKK